MCRSGPNGMPKDWNAAAAAVAEHISAHLFGVHRGSVPWRNSRLSVVFGNDGYDIPPAPGQGDCERAQVEVHLLRRRLSDLGIREMGFGLCDDGYTWAMIVHSGNRVWLAAEVGDAWRIACGGSPDDPEWRAFKQARGLTGTEDLSPGERQPAPRIDGAS